MEYIHELARQFWLRQLVIGVVMWSLLIVFIAGSLFGIWRSIHQDDHTRRGR